MWLMKLFPRLQPIVILILFIVFLWIFGIKAYKKFRSYEVYIKETVVEYPEGLEAPAMTICVDAVREEGVLCTYDFQNLFQGICPSCRERGCSSFPRRLDTMAGKRNTL